MWSTASEPGLRVLEMSCSRRPRPGAYPALSCPVLSCPALMRNPACGSLRGGITAIFFTQGQTSNHNNYLNNSLSSFFWRRGLPVGGIPSLSGLSCRCHLLIWLLYTFDVLLINCKFVVSRGSRRSASFQSHRKSCKHSLSVWRTSTHASCTFHWHVHSLGIGHVRYISILTWFRGFLLPLNSQGRLG